MHHQVETWAKWGFISKILLMTLATIAVMDSFRRLRLFVLTIAFCFTSIIFKCLPFMVSTGMAFAIRGPANTMVADNNDLGLALNMTLPLFFFLAQTEHNRWMKRFFWMMFVICIPCIFCTYSRGALLGLCSIFALMVLTMKHRFVLIAVVLFCGGLALLFAPEKWKERMNPSQEIDVSAQARLNTWQYCFNLASDFPLTGGGFATFTMQLYPRYAPAGSMPLGPHSIYFGILAEHGFMGLFLYLALLARCHLTTWKVSRLAMAYGDRTFRAYAYMCAFSLMGFMASGTFLGRQYFDYYFCIVACVGVLPKIAREELAKRYHEEDDEEEDEEQHDGSDEGSRLVASRGLAVEGA
jgi:probable O-glycosylation ligase (exosortase A-associated)